MGCSCCDFRDAADRQFTAAKAAKELQVYRKGRLGPTTRHLRDGIVDVGLNRGSLLDIGGGVAVSSAGDPALFLSLTDAQELQFKKSNDAIRNERERLAFSLHAIGVQAPALARQVTDAIVRVDQNTHIANAIAVRVAPTVDPSDVARDIGAWSPYGVLTTAEQEQLLTSIVIDKVSRQIRLFTVILLLVSTVIIALIIYTMTVDKIREIATLKLIGAPERFVAKMIVQQSVALGTIAFAVGAGLINAVHERFPRRVVLVPTDEILLLGILMIICIVASLLGIRRARSVEPLQALGG